jgi:preprotein translocase subunit SecF
MTERVWIFLIVAIAIIVVVFLLRRKLSRLLFKGGGIEAEVATHNPLVPADAQPSRQASVTISANKLTGKRQRIEVDRNDTNVSGNKLKGEDQEILARPDNPQQQ